MSEVWDHYRKQPGVVLGFHGCDKTVGEAVLAGERQLRASENDYDWLGSGIYFWEGNPERALQFAENASRQDFKTTRGKITTPFVVGAVIDLGRCANLMESAALTEVGQAHRSLMASTSLLGHPMPENVFGEDKVIRRLDRAVIEFMHALRVDRGLPSYDTVRALFKEGRELYDGAGFHSRTHIQIAVRDAECIRGYFRPIPKRTRAKKTLIVA